VHEFYKHGAPTALWLDPTAGAFNGLLAVLLRAFFQQKFEFSDRFQIFSTSCRLRDA